MIEGGRDIALPRTGYIFCEISAIELYKGQVKFRKLDKQLEKLGFQLYSHNVSLGFPMGDALYVRTHNPDSAGPKLATSLAFEVFCRIYHSEIAWLIRKVRDKLTKELRKSLPLERTRSELK